MRTPVKAMILLLVSFLLVTAGTVSAEPVGAAVEGHDLTFVDGDSGSGKIAVRPTGVDDTANIRWALENVAAGGTVTLDGDLFIVTESTVIEPHEIEVNAPNTINSDVGVFEGAGRSVTVVEARRQLDGSGFELATFSGGPYTTMFNFRRPAYPLTIADMTLRVGDVNIADEFIGPFDGQPTTGMLNTLAVGDLHFDLGFPPPMFDTPVVFKNLAVLGLDRRSEFGSDEEYFSSWYGRKNQHYGLITVAMTDVVVKDCHVEHASGDAIEFLGMAQNGQGTIKNSTVAHGAGIGLYWVNAAKRGDVVVKGNTLIDIFDDHQGVGLFGFFVGPSSNVVIKENDFSLSGKTQSFVGIFDWGFPVSGSLVKIDNDDLPGGGPGSVALGPGRVTNTRIVIDNCEWVDDQSDGPTTCKD